MADIQLSPHFLLSELIASQTAVRLNRPIICLPGSPEFNALQAWCENIGEPVHEHFNSPIIVSSGLRPPWLNANVGGASSSQHEKGEAVDFTVRGHSVEDVARWIADESGLPFDQLIWEFDAWVHCSYSPRNRRQVLTAKHGDRATVYMPGLVPFTQAA